MGVGSGSKLLGVFDTELHGDFMRLAVMAFGLAVEHAVHLVAGVTVRLRPVGKGDPALAEMLFYFVGGHGGLLFTE